MVADKAIFLKQRIFNFVDILYFRATGRRAGENAKNFINGLSWSFFGGIIASLVMLGLTIVAARYLGPVEYGKYNLVLVMSQLLLIPILFGIDISSVRAVAMSKNSREMSGNISAALYFVVFMILFLGGVIFFGKEVISEKFAISQDLLFAIFLFSALSAIKVIFDGFIRGMSLFKYQFLSRIVEIFFVVSAFVVFFILLNERDYLHYIYSLGVGFFVVAVVYFKRIKNFLGRFDVHLLFEQLSYGKWIIVATILGTAFNSLDKLILTKYAGISELGMYSAYFMASTNLIAQVTQIFNNVFFPAISRLEDKSVLVHIEKISQKMLPFLIVGISCLVGGIVLLFGQAYRFDFWYVFGFGILASLQVILTVNSSIITALSKHLFKKYTIYLNIVNLFHVIIFGILIYFQAVSIGSILFFWIINVAISIFIQRRLINSALNPVRG